MKLCVPGPMLRVLGLSLLVAVGCDNTMEPSAQPAVEAVLNVPVSLSAGQTAALAEQKLSVTFLGVLDDTRCPVDVLCTLPGNATISVRAEQVGRTALISSLTLYDDPQGVVYGGFAIHAQQLMPERVSDRTIRPEDYSVRLLVDRP